VRDDVCDRPPAERRAEVPAYREEGSRPPGIIHRKIEKTLSDPHRYKNLRQPLQHLKRVHVGKKVVLVLSVDEEEHLVIIEDYDHHDNIYRR